MQGPINGPAQKISVIQLPFSPVSVSLLPTNAADLLRCIRELRHN
jgi:hypothetical protein